MKQIGMAVLSVFALVLLAGSASAAPNECRKKCFQENPCLKNFRSCIQGKKVAQRGPCRKSRQECRQKRRPCLQACPATDKTSGAAVADKASADKASAGDKASADKASADKASADKASADKASGDKASGDKATGGSDAAAEEKEEKGSE